MIADMANTSPATVSRALTNNGNVNEDTVRRIEQAMQDVGYVRRRKNAINASLLERVVLVIASDITSQIYIDYFTGVNDYLTERGFLCTESFASSEELVLRHLQTASDNHFGGVVLLNILESPELIRQLQRVDCPVLFINRYLRSMEADTVCVDNYQGGYLATQYLINAGHRRILHLAGIPNSVVSQERLFGYHDAMFDAGLPVPDDSIVRGDLTEKSGFALGERLAKEKNDFTGIFVSNDMMAVGLVNGLRHCGKSIPEDYSIVSFDTTPLAKNASIRLTTIGFESYKMGLSAGELIYQKITAKVSQEPRKIVYPAKIDEGDSVRSLQEP